MTENKAGSARLKKLEAIHERAAFLLMQRGNVQAVAAEIGVHPDTISNWKRCPKFKRFYNKIRREAYDEAIGVLQAASLAAAAKLAHALGWDDPDNLKTALTEEGHTKHGRHDLSLQAAREIIALSGKWFNEVDMVERLEQVERKLRQQES